MSEQPDAIIDVIERDEPVTCADLDEDCADVQCKLTCWLYDPQRGMCPYLRSRSTEG